MRTFTFTRVGDKLKCAVDNHPYQVVADPIIEFDEANSLITFYGWFAIYLNTDVVTIAGTTYSPGAAAGMTIYDALLTNSY